MEALIQAVITMLAVINPAMSGVILLEITSNVSKKEKYIAATKGVLQIFAILLLVTFVGKKFLEIFGISHETFRIVGGIVIAYIGFTMLTGKINTNINKKEKELNISPLIMFSASPGTIATLITISVGQDYFIPTIAITAVLICMLITYITILIMIKITKNNNSQHKLFTQFMGLILIAMGLQFALESYKTFML